MFSIHKRILYLLLFCVQISFKYKQNTSFTFYKTPALWLRKYDVGCFRDEIYWIWARCDLITQNQRKWQQDPALAFYKSGKFNANISLAEKKHLSLNMFYFKTPQRCCSPACGWDDHKNGLVKKHLVTSLHKKWSISIWPQQPWYCWLNETPSILTHIHPVSNLFCTERIQASYYPDMSCWFFSCSWRTLSTWHSSTMRD